MLMSCQVVNALYIWQQHWQVCRWQGVAIFGFVAKELLYTATHESPVWVFTLQPLCSQCVIAALSIEIGYKIFQERGSNAHKDT